MNKSLLALLLVCTIAGMAYAASYNDEEQDARQLIEVLQALQSMEDMNEQVNQQSSVAKAQFLGRIISGLSNLLGR